MLLLLTVAGCTDDFGMQTEGDTDAMDVQLNISFLFNDGIERSATRSEAFTRADETTPGKPVPESELKSLSVFIVNRDESGTAVNASIKAFRFTENLPGYQPDGTGRNVYTAKVKTDTGSKYIYMGANLSEMQESGFVKEYKSAGERAVLSSDNGGTGFITTEDGFTMFCNNKLDVTVTPTQLIYPDESSSYKFQMERLVAKILITADTYEGSNYIKIGNEAEGENGWIDMADYSMDSPCYWIRTENKKVYPFPVEEGGKRIDPNYKFSDSDIADFLERSRDGFLVKYDAGKMPKADSDPEDGSVYTEGIYCMENMVNEGSGGNGLDENRKKYTTYVELYVQYIPRHLYIAEAGKIVRKSYQTRQDAYNVIMNNEQASGTGGNTYTLDTDPRYYYTAEAKAIAVKSGMPDTSFAEYVASKHYYQTYIDGRVNPTTGRMEFDSERSGVYRNRYYILRITNFDIRNGPAVQVTSTVLPWTKVDGTSWYSEMNASLSAAYTTKDYTAVNNPNGIPIDFNMMNTTGGGTDDYNATFTLELTGVPGISWVASLTNPNDFGLYVSSDKGLVANGTLPTKAEDSSVQENADGTVTKAFNIAVYAKRASEGVTRTTYLSITANGERQLINTAGSTQKMPGDDENVWIMQY